MFCSEFSSVVYSPVCFSRLESQMTSDIKAILCLLQRSSSAGPPAYSAVTASLEKEAVRAQPAVNTGTPAIQVTLLLYSFHNQHNF